jgi:hypothetical protein
MLSGTRSGNLDDLLSRICKNLQLSDTQYNSAKTRYESIGDWLAAPDSPLAAWKPSIYPQGSLRIGTTVKPIRGAEYDLDLVCEMAINWQRVTPREILDMVEARIRAHGTLRQNLDKKRPRCVRLTYANDFHLDIVPACPDEASGSGLKRIPDRVSGWRPSNPKGYAQWFESRAMRRVLEAAIDPLPEGELPKAPLQHAVQLLKRWRDLTFQGNLDSAPKSIVLTTLAATAYDGQRSLSEAMKSILASISFKVTSRIPFQVLNPAHSNENMADSWNSNPEEYALFVTGISSLSRQWHAITQASGFSTLSGFLSQLFGEDMTKRAFNDQAEALTATRNLEQVGVSRGDARLVGRPTPGAIPMKRHTFFGE